MAKTVDANLINPFLAATIEGLSVMAGLQPARVRLFLKTSTRMHGDYGGVIGMTNGVTGSCVLSFPDSLARRIVARMMSEPDPQSLAQELILDGIGEMANLVAGGAKRTLAGGVHHFDISTPTLLFGSPIELYNPPETVSIAAEFTAHPDWKETFLFELATKPKELVR
jgi:chemotaxis protein CheX